MIVKIFCLSILIVSLSSNALLARGFDATRIGFKGFAMAGTMTGIADDASAVYYNPAGLAMMESNTIKFELSFSSLFTDCKYTNPSGVKNKSDEFSILPSFFISKTLDNNLAFGFGVYVAYGGGGVKYTDFEAISMESGEDFEAMSGFIAFSPAISYKVLPNLSLGMAINGYYGRMEEKYTLAAGVAGPFPMPIETKYDGFAGYNAHFGLLYKPSDNVKVGLFIRTPTGLEVEGTHTSKGVEEDSKIKMTVPVKIALGMSYKVNKNLLVAGNIGYVFNEEMDEITLAHESGDVVRKTGYKNFVDFGLGVEYITTNKLNLYTGLRHIQSGAKKEYINHISYDMPYWVLTGGASYSLTKAFEIDFTLGRYLGDDQKSSSGKYEANNTIIHLGIKGNF